MEEKELMSEDSQCVVKGEDEEKKNHSCRLYEK
jgi:hypothetical protein